MTPLLSTAIGLVIAAISGLLLLALAAATVLLIVLVLLSLDHLLQRNGVDRRTGAGRLWSRVRGPRSAGRAAPTSSGDQHGDGHDSPSAPRVPFSARRPGRGTRPATSASTTTTPAPTTPATAIAVTSTPEPRATAAAPTAPPTAEPAAVAAPAAPPAGTATPAAPTPAAPAGGASDAHEDAVTEVLPVKAPARTTSATTRTPRTPAPRTRTPRAAKPALRGPAAAAPAPAAPGSPAGAPTPAAADSEGPSADRDSAIDRLFAPLLESDRTEPLPRARSARRPDDEA